MTGGHEFSINVNNSRTTFSIYELNKCVFLFQRSCMKFLVVCYFRGRSWGHFRCGRDMAVLPMVNRDSNHTAGQIIDSYTNLISSGLIMNENRDVKSMWTLPDYLGTHFYRNPLLSLLPFMNCLLKKYEVNLITEVVWIIMKNKIYQPISPHKIHFYMEGKQLLKHVHVY